MISEVARRYAQALYELAKANNKADLIFSETRIVAEAISKNSEIQIFMTSPLVAPDQKVKALSTALQGKISEELLGTLKVMAEKHRLEFFSQMAAALEEINDEAHGITRGVVTSAAPMDATERKRIEETIQKVTKKNVILSYHEDANLLGGMVAQVGGWTFDDSLKSHLHKISEELNRRAN